MVPPKITLIIRQPFSAVSTPCIPQPPPTYTTIWLCSSKNFFFVFSMFYRTRARRSSVCTWHVSVCNKTRCTNSLQIHASIVRQQAAVLVITMSSTRGQAQKDNIPVHTGPGIPVLPKSYTYVKADFFHIIKNLHVPRHNLNVCDILSVIPIGQTWIGNFQNIGYWYQLTNSCPDGFTWKSKCTHGGQSSS